jgi:hypothetical protein
MKMRKISLLAAAVVIASGVGMVSTAGTAFAACLNPDAGAIDLTHNAMQPGAGWGYDKTAVDKELAKGNRCSLFGDNATVQQSAPIPPDTQLNHGSDQGNGMNQQQ